MAKKSKRQRRLEKERELKKGIVTKKQRRGYTKHKKRICEHYSCNAAGGYYDTYLTKNEDGTYKCSGCGKIFNDEQVERIESLCKYLTTPGVKTAEEIAKLLTTEIMPNEYYYVASDEMVICETIEWDPKMLIRHYENSRMKTKSETLECLETLIEKARNKKLCAKDATEIFGEPHTIFYENPMYPSPYCSYDYYPYYQPEELLDILKSSAEPDDAYKRIGRMLSLSNLTHGITKRFNDVHVKRLNELLDKYEGDLEKIETDSEEWQKLVRSNIYNDADIRNEEKRCSSDLLPQYESIFFREDLFEYLLQKGLDNKSAYALMNIAGEESKFPLFRFHRYESFKRSKVLDKEFYEWAEKVRYLPSRRLIFEIFYEATA